MRVWKIGLLAVFLLVGCSSSSQHRYRLAICAIFKNEAPWLKEWLVYHHDVLKADHFYLYNNDSSDNYKEVLQPFIDRGIVELIDWGSDDPSRSIGALTEIPLVRSQLGAYNDCLKNRALGEAQWVAVIDIDEFIVPIQGVKSFYALLRDAEKKKRGTVALLWRVFGTSDVDDLTEGSLLTENLLWRSQDDHPWNRLAKSIHRPEAISSCLVHMAEKLEPNFGAKTFRANQMRIHHYWTRTGKFCSEKRNMSKGSSPEFFETLHQVEDRAMLQYVPQLKKQLVEEKSKI